MPTDEQIIRKYLELRAQEEVLKNKHKLELMPLKKDMAVLEEVMGIILSSRATIAEPFPIAKTEAGTAYKKRIFNASITDKPVFLNFAFENDMSLLDIRVSETGVRAHIDKKIKEQLHLPPEKKTNPAVPGVKTDRFDKVIFRNI